MKKKLRQQLTGIMEADMNIYFCSCIEKDHRISFQTNTTPKAIAAMIATYLANNEDVDDLVCEFMEDAPPKSRIVEQEIIPAPITKA